MPGGKSGRTNRGNKSGNAGRVVQPYAETLRYFEAEDEARERDRRRREELAKAAKGRISLRKFSWEKD